MANLFNVNFRIYSIFWVVLILILFLKCSLRGPIYLIFLNLEAICEIIILVVKILIPTLKCSFHGPNYLIFVNLKEICEIICFLLQGILRA